MPTKEKAHLSGGPIPNNVLADGPDPKATKPETQAGLAQLVFSRSFIVVHAPITRTSTATGVSVQTPRAAFIRKPSRIRAWRAA
jgi:hypothetical protein